MGIEVELVKKIKKTTKKCTFSVIKTEKPGYFHLKPTDKINYIQSRLYKMKPLLLEYLGIQDFNPINYRSIKPFYTFGIISSASGAKLEQDTPVYIFNDIDDSNFPVKLDLSALDSYSIFNGQIVAIKGTNARGDTILVESMCSTPSLSEYNAEKTEINAIVCKGPYSVLDLQCIFANDANPYILFGPFCSENENHFSSFSNFSNALEPFLSKNPLIKIIIVPSLEDNCSVQVFPQPKIRSLNERIVSLDNPSYLLHNNHLILLSNFDSFIDLCYEEMAKEPSKQDDGVFQKDRIQRLASHLVMQQSLCPVINSKADVAFGNWLNMKYSPDLYIISSKMKSFTREVGPVTLFNTGILTKAVYKVVSNGNQKYSIEKIS